MLWINISAREMYACVSTEDLQGIMKGEGGQTDRHIFNGNVVL